MDGYHFGLVPGQLEQVAPEKLDLLLICRLKNGCGGCDWGGVEIGRGCHQRRVIDDSIDASWGHWVIGCFGSELMLLVVMATGLGWVVHGCCHRDGHLGGLGQVLPLLLHKRRLMHMLLLGLHLLRVHLHLAVRLLPYMLLGWLWVPILGWRLRPKNLLMLLLRV